MERYVREAVISEAASKARATQLGQTIDPIAGDAAATPLTEEFDKARVLEWVREHLAGAAAHCEELLDALAAKVEEKLGRASRPAAAASTSSVPSSDGSAPEAVESPTPIGPPSPEQFLGEVAHKKYERRHAILVGRLIPSRGPGPPAVAGISATASRPGSQSRGMYLATGVIAQNWGEVTKMAHPHS